MSKHYRILAGAALLLLGACAAETAPIQLAGPAEAMARAPRPANRGLSRCAMPALDNAVAADLLMSATMGGPPVVVTVYECQRRI